MTSYGESVMLRPATELIVPNDDNDNLETIDDAMRERLEDDTERFLYELYGTVSDALAARFQRLLEQAKHELGVLRKIARSLEVVVAEEPARFANPRVDRVVWRQVARSSTLALFDWLTSNASGRPIPSATWARQCCTDALDFDRYRQETSLQVDDAKLAVEVSAHTIVESGMLEQPRPMWYRGQHVTLLASAGQIWSMTTKSQPMMWVPLAGKERPILKRTEDRISVWMPQATELDLVPLTPWIGVHDAGHQLIVGPSIRKPEGESARVSNGVGLKIDDRCRSVKTPSGIRIACNSPGTLSFSAPRNALTSYDHGLLLEWKMAKDVR